MHGPLAKYWGGRPPRIGAPDSTHLNPALKLRRLSLKRVGQKHPLTVLSPFLFITFAKMLSPARVNVGWGSAPDPLGVLITLPRPPSHLERENPVLTVTQCSSSVYLASRRLDPRAISARLRARVLPLLFSTAWRTGPTPNPLDDCITKCPTALCCWSQVTRSKINRPSSTLLVTL